jgi:hypothetical protein
MVPPTLKKLEFVERKSGHGVPAGSWLKRLPWTSSPCAILAIRGRFSGAPARLGLTPGNAARATCSGTSRVVASADWVAAAQIVPDASTFKFAPSTRHSAASPHLASRDSLQPSRRTQGSLKQTSQRMHATPSSKLTPHQARRAILPCREIITAPPKAREPPQPKGTTWRPQPSCSAIAVRSSSRGARPRADPRPTKPRRMAPSWAMGARL